MKNLRCTTVGFGVGCAIATGPVLTGLHGFLWVACGVLFVVGWLRPVHAPSWVIQAGLLLAVVADIALGAPGDAVLVIALAVAASMATVHLLQVHVPLRSGS